MSEKVRYINLTESLKSALKIRYEDVWEEIYYKVFMCKDTSPDNRFSKYKINSYLKAFERLLLGYPVVPEKNIDNLIEFYADKPLNLMYALQSKQIYLHEEFLRLSVSDLMPELEEKDNMEGMTSMFGDY